MNWRNYLYYTDFSTDEALLRRLPVGPLSTDNAQMLAVILSNHDTGEGKANWSVEGVDNAWRLADAVVIQNGPNDRRLPTKYSYTNALVLEFPEVSVAPVGRIYVQFNAPVDTSIPDSSGDPAPDENA